MHRDKLESSTERKREKGHGKETKEWSRKKSSVWKKKPTQTNEKCGVGVLKANKVK